MAEDHEDEITIRRALRGDEEAWRGLVEKYRVYVYRMGWRVVMNEEDAMDVVQETFMKVAAQLGRFRGEGSFRAWLTTIAMREAVSLCRRRNSQPVGLDDETLEVLAERDGAAGEDMAAMLDDIRRRERVEAAMAELAPQQRAILLLGIRNDLGPGEVAREMGLPANQVRSQWSRAVTRLRQILKDDVSE